MAVATVAGTSAGSASGARSTQTTPSAKEAATSVMMASASRVLPTPPGPVKVNSGTASSRRKTPAAARSLSRPVSRVRGIGSASADQEAGTAIGTSPDAWQSQTLHSVPDCEEQSCPGPALLYPGLVSNTHSLPRGPADHDHAMNMVAPVPWRRRMLTGGSEFQIRQGRSGETPAAGP